MDEKNSVHSPSHYTGGVETIRKIELVTAGLPAWEAYNLGQVIRYCDRAGLKGSAATDLGKARNYAHRLCYGCWEDSVEHVGTWRERAEAAESEVLEMRELVADDEVDGRSAEPFTTTKIYCTAPHYMDWSGSGDVKFAEITGIVKETLFGSPKPAEPEQPADSWEQLEADAKISGYCEYFSKDSDGSCYMCRKRKEYEDVACQIAHRLDIVHRAKALAGVE